MKAVIQAIPTYCMSVFMLPKEMCAKINSLTQKFWWDEGRIPWMSWSKMGIEKMKEGMGFQDFNCFNKALLAKQFWKIWQNPDSLVSRIMKAKYFANCSILEAKMGYRPSFAWRSILGSCELVKEGMFWRIGNGESTAIRGKNGFFFPPPIPFNLFLDFWTRKRR